MSKRRGQRRSTRKGSEGSRDTPRSAHSDSFRSDLDELVATETGLEFVYSSLDALAARYTLSEAVLVLHDNGDGVQVFRLGGKVLDVNFPARRGLTPGLYCTPAIVSADDAALLLKVCQRAFSSPWHVPKQAPRRQLPTLGAEPTPSLEAATSLAAVTASSLGGGMPFPKRAIQGPPSGTRRWISSILLVVDLLTLAITVAGVHGELRYVLGLVLGLAIPGWSIIGVLRLGNTALEIALTLAASLTLLMLAAQILITVKFWHPILLEEFTCVVCFPSLLWQSRRLPRVRGRG